MTAPSKRSPYGFTLIELLVVIGIIAVLVSLGAVSYNKAQSAARDVKRKTDLEDLKKAFYLYKTTTGRVCVLSSGSCDSDPAWQTNNFFDPGFSGTKPGNVLAPYLKAPIINDPGGNGGGIYVIQIWDNDSFTITAYLENPATGSCPSPYPWSGVSGANLQRLYCITE